MENIRNNNDNINLQEMDSSKFVFNLDDTNSVENDSKIVYNYYDTTILKTDVTLETSSGSYAALFDV